MLMLFNRLLRLFCCPPFPSRIVAKLAFNPPICNYYFEKQGDKDDYNLVLFENPLIHSDTTNFNTSQSPRSQCMCRTSDCNCKAIGTSCSSSQHVHSTERVTLDCNLENGVRQFRPKETDAYFVNTSEGNKIAVVYAHPIKHSKHILLLSHGNAMDIGDSILYMVYLCGILKCNIITYDYSGYGISSGKPLECNLYRDIRAVYDSIYKRYGFNQENIILFGISIGSVPTIDLASQENFAGVIIQSGLASGLQIISQNLKQIACFNPFPSIDKIQNIKSPVLIIHGMDDAIININHGRELYQNVQNKVDPLFAIGCGHNDVDLNENYFPRLYHFIHNEV
ncbi:hypothetical protein A3Q56_01197 [Intoshia linei]|uniref:Serine aminopeptidase S33 domain-containing protein n=1 Tax=Intoshia linei TaxID=1819745 RepID=A0A177BBL4_9BILA|nr:hypothetical protein A3Q56_01197 [Intoshia linei]